jgi:hypothetical protein
MSTNQNNHEEEVDLGSLFVIIGKGFSKIFNFIGNIFRGIFHGIISVLLFLRSNLLKIGVAALLGGALGFFIETKKVDAFESDLILEPNFKSTRQLYKNINYYNNLVIQADTMAIATAFNLDKLSAASLNEFRIEPVIVDSDIINAYDDLILSVDSLTIKSYDYFAFEASFTKYDYRFHKVTVSAKKNDIFKELGNVIISSVEKNAYFNRLKVLTNENLNRTDSLYRENLIEIDSLRKVYMQVMIAEADKQSNGTNIDLGGQNSTAKELELFAVNKEINEDLQEISLEKATQYEVINVLSNFQPIGSKIKGVTNNYAFLLTGFGASCMILFLLLIKLNRYLNSYEK